MQSYFFVTVVDCPLSDMEIKLHFDGVVELSVRSFSLVICTWEGLLIRSAVRSEWSSPTIIIQILLYVKIAVR